MSGFRNQEGSGKQNFVLSRPEEVPVEPAEVARAKAGTAEFEILPLLFGPPPPPLLCELLLRHTLSEVSVLPADHVL